MDNLMNKYRLGAGGETPEMHLLQYNTSFTTASSFSCAQAGRWRWSVKSPGHGRAAGCVTRDARRSLRRAWPCGGAGGFARVFECAAESGGQGFSSCGAAS